MITILGKVIHGDHYGRQLGFPTANVDRRQYVREKMKVRLGVWSGEVKVKSGKLEQHTKNMRSDHSPKFTIIKSCIHKFQMCL